MAQLLSNRAAVISYGLLIGWQVPPATDQFTAGSWWWDVCAPGLLRHHNLQATRLFCQHPVSPDLEGLPNLGDLPHLVLSFDLIIRSGIHSYAICAACASPMRHRYAVDMQRMRNSSAGNVPPNHNQTISAILLRIWSFFSYAVRAPWHRRPVEQGHTTAGHSILYYTTTLTLPC